MKRAIVLGGGGSKGAYQVGFVKAILELGIDYDIITGTSIGALNGCLLAQKEEVRLIELWNQMDISKIIKGDLPDNFAIEDLLKSANAAMSFFKQFKKNKVDNSPFIKLIDEYFNAEKLSQSSIDYACVSVSFPSMQPKYATKEDMLRYGKNYLAASSACFPAFPIHEFEEGSFVDGGYHDNLPIDLAIRLGASEFIIVDLNPDTAHPHYINYPNMTYIYPKEYIGSFLNFDQFTIQRNIRLGYHDTLKAFGKLDGYRYSFYPYHNKNLFNNYYNLVLRIEAGTKVGEKMNNNEAIFKIFRQYSKQATLSQKDLVYISMDYLLDYLHIDSSFVLDFKNSVKLILNHFKLSLSVPQTDSMSLKADTLVKRFVKQNKIDILKMIVNVTKYPDQYSQLVIKYLDFDPLFNALASFILLLEKEVAHEN